MTAVTAAAARLDETDFQELERSFSGRLVRAGDAAYDEARRIWNGSISKFPAVVAYCTGVADVVAALQCARSTGLPVAVRSGGHSFPGQSLCEGGLVIDLSVMNGVRVDPENRTVRAQAGVLLGALDRETQLFGLAVPSGIVTHTGLAGLTLGGGIGWLMRKYGLTGAPPLPRAAQRRVCAKICSDLSDNQAEVAEVQHDLGESRTCPGGREDRRRTGLPRQTRQGDLGGNLAASAGRKLQRDWITDVRRTS